VEEVPAVEEVPEVEVLMTGNSRYAWDLEKYLRGTQG